MKPTDLDVPEGEVLVILGPSGSGKSTLLHLLGGIDRPSAGTILFRDQELTGLDASWLTPLRRRHVGFVFQFYNLITRVTALENVAMATEVAPNPRDTRAMIEMVGLAERADHFPVPLPGAREIMRRPDNDAPGVWRFRAPLGILGVGLARRGRGRSRAGRAGRDPAASAPVSHARAKDAQQCAGEHQFPRRTPRCGTA